MRRSAAAAGTTAVRNTPRELPSSGSPDYRQSGFLNKKAGRSSEKGGPQRGVAMRATQRTIQSDLAAAGLMPGGKHSVPGPGGHELPANAETRRVSDAADADFLHGGGWHVVSIKGGDEEGGVTSHRGVTHPDEYVDDDVLQGMVEAELGFTYEQVRSVYRQGPLSAEGRGLRGCIDARLLALSLSGGNMAELGRALGFPIRESGECRVIESALARARKEQL